MRDMAGQQAESTWMSTHEQQGGLVMLGDTVRGDTGMWHVVCFETILKT